MIFLKQRVPGVALIESEPFEDERGSFFRHFCRKEFEEHGIMTRVAQCNVSENKSRHTVRGFHYQLPPHAEGKVLSCFRGAIYDVVVDLRPESPMYLKWMALELTQKKCSSLYVPPGCANAYLTLEDDTQIFYYHSEFYTPGSEGGIRYNDPLFNFEWPYEPGVISEKDKTYPDFIPQKRKTFIRK